MFIVEWWNELNLATQIFYCIAIPATLVLLIQTVTMFFGMDDNADGVGDIELDNTLDGIDDIELDSGFDGMDEPDALDGIFGEDSITEPSDSFGWEGLRIFTVRGLIAFFVVFGWVGVAMQSGGISLWITIPVALLCGFAMMVALAFLMRAVMKLRSDGNTDNRNAIGTSGKVHLTIPPERMGEGKVHIMLQGTYVERNAVTDQAEPIPTGSEIVVIGVSGQTDLIVRKK